MAEDGRALFFAAEVAAGGWLRGELAAARGEASATRWPTVVAAAPAAALRNSPGR
jgi:hypothetical protein